MVSDITPQNIGSEKNMASSATKFVVTSQVIVTEEQDVTLH
jgi:hypothetical protein